MNAVPPPRYRIVERGRRLITIDSRSGEELGMSATLGADPLFGTPPVRVHARVALPSTVASAAASASTISTSRPASVVGKPSALAPARTSTQAKSGSGRWVVLAMIGMAILIFLIATGLWIFVVALFIIPLTRGFLMQALRAGWPRIKAWAETGSAS